jgi:hypothetical protein
MVRTQVQLTEVQAEALRALAARTNTSVAELVRQGVEALIRSGGGTTTEERRRRAIEAAGRFRSDRSDVSEQHDQHLVEAYRS